jgi:hypothetical protein
VENYCVIKHLLTLMKGARSCCGRGWLVTIKCWKRYPHPRTPFIAIGTYTKIIQNGQDVYAMHYIEIQARVYLETYKTVFSVHNKTAKQIIDFIFQWERSMYNKFQFPEEFITAQLVRLCGLVVRVPGYRSSGPGSIPGATRFSE